jgi:pimeloyl-ACP methyl ester carboxylesterase
MPRLRLSWIRLARLLALLLPACSRDAAPSFTDGFVQVSGGDGLYYRLFGVGPDTVVALHGGPALSSGYLEDGLAPLARHHAILFYDQRGRGRSSAVPVGDALSYARDLADLEEVRAHFRLDSMVLIGHHWGAGLAFGYSLRHPERVRRLILLSPMPYAAGFIYQLALTTLDTAARARWLRATEQHADSLDPMNFCRAFWGFEFSPTEVTEPAVVRRLAPAMCGEPPDRLRWRPVIQRQLMYSLGKWDWRDSLPLVTRTALVLVGRDVPGLSANAIQWARGIPAGRLLQVGQTALFPWLDGRAEFMAALDRFIQGNWPDGALHPDTVRTASRQSPEAGGS